MPKDFSEFETKQENFSDFNVKKTTVDPNFTLNQATAQEIMNKKLSLYNMGMIARGFLSVLTAPLTTLQVSLQLSVLPHQNKFGDMNEFDKNQLMKVPKEITPYEKRRYELIVKSGVTGTNKPFRAPVYLTYQEAFKALANQGILGFYKGNMVGLAHAWFNTYLKFTLMNVIEMKTFNNPKNDSQIFNGVFTLFAITFIDILSHPIQLMQSRFILQNRTPNFRTYKSAFHFFRKHHRRLSVLFNGWRVHLPKNLLIGLGSKSGIIKDNPLLAFLTSQMITETLVYPLMTAQRRIHCQDTVAGMLPVRYSGIWHALKLIRQEEGVRGLYRGFTAFLPAHLLTAFALLSVNLFGDQMFTLTSEQQ